MVKSLYECDVCGKLFEEKDLFRFVLKRKILGIIEIEPQIKMVCLECKNKYSTRT